jgi:toxin-antitoxin system PIN domain toxin
VKKGLDTNVLVYAHMPALTQHEKVRGFLLDQLNDPDTTLAITPSTMHEFVHIVTDSKRFDPPVGMAEALAVARIYLGRSNVECLTISEEVLYRAFDLLERHRLGKKRIADTLLAATLQHHKIAELVTCNPADFQVFEDLAVIDPRSS